MVVPASIHVKAPAVTAILNEMVTLVLATAPVIPAEVFKSEMSAKTTGAKNLFVPVFSKNLSAINNHSKT